MMGEPDQAANLRSIHAMNPAHILVECATNSDWGRQLTLADDLNLDSYSAAADTLFEEGFGLCFRYNRQDGLDTFVQQILDHLGAVQYADLETGKLTLKQLRGDYNVDELPVFTYDNGIIAVQDDDCASTTSNPNEVVVTWNDPVTNSDGEVRAQNLGAIQNTGLELMLLPMPAESQPGIHLTRWPAVFPFQQMILNGKPVPSRHRRGRSASIQCCLLRSGLKPAGH